MKIDSRTEYTDAPQHHFASDNNSPVHPEIMDAIDNANKGHVLAYGDDYYTQQACTILKQVFGKECETFFVFTGTGANVLSISAVTRSYNAVICAEPSHINAAECGGPEKFAGTKLLTVPTDTGKIGIEDIEQFFARNGDQHHVQPRVVSLTQATDFGLCYTPEEITEMCEFCHRNGLVVHMDGARFFTACEALGVSPKELSTDTGLDVLSLGGTKNGALISEAVLFLRPECARDFPYIRKQGMQLASKMRFLAVQMDALFTDNLWQRNAKKANSMARKLADLLEQIPEVDITRTVQTNMIFCTIPAIAITEIRKQYCFYVYDEERSEVRLVANYDTTDEDVIGFVAVLKRALEEL